MPKFLTLEDLYDYCSSSATTMKFSAKSEDDVLAVQMPATLTFAKKKKVDENCEELLPVTLHACHSGKNVNTTIISQEKLEERAPSIKNRPILAFIHKVNGQWEFYRHNQHEDENGETVFDEIPVGVIPESCNIRFEKDKESGRNYLVVDGLIYEEYNRAAEILRREEECWVSVELFIKSFSYDAKEKAFSIDDFYFNGVTILGKDENGREIQPGMTGSHINIKDFSKKDNSNFENVDSTMLYEEIENIKKKIEFISQTIENSKEGGDTVTKFEELLAKYNVTAEEVTFEYDGLSDEELEAKFAEVFAQGEPEGESENDPEQPENEPTNGEDEGAEPDVKPEDGEGEGAEPAPTEGDGTEDEGVVEPVAENSVSYSIAFGEGKKDFALTLSDYEYALHCLINSTYEEDGYYSVTVYPDEKYVIMENWCNGEFYRQNYSHNEDTFELKGDRVRVYHEFVTEEEQAALAEMKSNYEAMSQKVASYEAAEMEAAKTDILTSADYSSISDTEEFKALMENHAEFSIAELQNKCDVMLANSVKAVNRANFEAAPTTGRTKRFPVAYQQKVAKTSGRYGTLFSKNK